jgi:hypothetical protein
LVFKYVVVFEVDRREGKIIKELNNKASAYINK